MSWKEKVKNWDGKLYKVLQGNKSCYGGNFEWSLPKDGKPGNWTPIIEDVEMCRRGYHLTTHYAHWADKENVSIYEAEGDVVAFDGYDKVVCTKVRLLKLVENPFDDSGYKNSGKLNSGDNNSGNYNSGSYNLGRRNSGDYNSGNKNSGNFNLGNWNSGNCNVGNSNSGNYNSGDLNSGSWNSGNMNSGNWNSSKGNPNFLCNISTPIIVFNKPAPSNWKPKFPEWMYFNLLINGYHESWQKAFEKADIEGIKELLALPNFDYEVFEDISSITKKQIKEKLGE